jgi:hypothetical protein
MDVINTHQSTNGEEAGSQLLMFVRSGLVLVAKSVDQL